MTHYYHDKERNEFRGPLTQEYPDMTGNQMLDEDNLVEFWNHVRELPSHPHAFSGESRVVPEDEIEWEYQIWDRRWQTCSQEDYEKETPNMRRRVATPINESPGYTSSSGEEVGANDYPGHQCGLSKFEWQMEKVIDEIRSKETTLECMAPLAKFLQSQQPPLTAQPVGFAEWLEDNKYWRNHNGIWFQGSSHVGNSIADLYTLFPGSKSAPQVIVDAALEMEINDILNECNGTGAGAVSVFNHLRQHYHITPKPDRHE